MTVELNVLMLGAGNRVSLCEWLIEAGWNYNRQVNIFSVEIKDPVPISKYAKILMGEKWDSPNFKDSILQIVKDNDINIILPLMDAATVALSKIKHEIEKETKAWAVVSSEDLCETFNDKVKSQHWFIQHGANIPGSWGNTYPRILKHKLGYGSRDQAIIRNEKEYLAFSSARDISNYIDQDFIQGTEYTVDAYVSRKAEIVGAVSRVRIETTNGEVTRGITKKEPEVLTEVNRILSFYGFEGPITLQFMVQKTSNIPFILEINPRLGGGCINSFKAGANFAEVLIAEYLGEPLPNCKNWVEGVLMMRANQEIWI